MKRIHLLLIPAIVIALAARPSRADDLYHYWPLDEGAGGTTANLGTSGAGAATVNNFATGGLGGGGAAWITNDALRGTVISGNGNDGSGAFVSTGNISDTTYNGNWTISAWINLESSGTGGNDVVLGNRFGGASSNWAKFTRSNYEWRPPGGTNFNIPDIPVDGNWEHHTVVKNGTIFDYYVNGVHSNNFSSSATFTGDNPFFIGGDAGGERPAGRYDDVGFFNDALEPGKITAITAAANNTNGLDYSLGDVNELFKIYDGEQDSFEIDGLKWIAATTDEINDAGLLGPIGIPQTDGDRFAILFDTAVGGVIVAPVPEPTSVAIWTLIGLSLVGFGYFRAKRKR